MYLGAVVTPLTVNTLNNDPEESHPAGMGLYDGWAQTYRPFNPIQPQLVIKKTCSVQDDFPDFSKIGAKAAAVCSTWLWLVRYVLRCGNSCYSDRPPTRNVSR